MTRRKFEIRDGVGGAAFAVHVITRAERAEIAGVHEGGALRIRLTSSPADPDLVNQELIAFLARWLQVAPGAIQIVAGFKGRDKLVSVDGLDPAVLDERLADRES
ncbi:MAG: DUF167 domain-containing protein [Anaerolineae bacterium]|nr:DUF167 domain-containing protein [Anaerolineae bacterium]